MMLEVKNMCKSFAGLKAVHQVSFRVEAGEILGLIGPNGAGKTTIFNLITKVFPLTSGQVCFEGRRIDQLKLPSRICRIGIGRTFQVVKPFGNMTVLENVMVGAWNRTGSRKVACQQAVRALTRVALIQKQHLRARSLTIVDRKRLEVARALATQPKLLLLDEVMAGLNPTEVEEIIPIIEKIRSEGTTILMIEHIMAAMMKLSDRIVVLNHGELLAEGTPESIAENEKVVEAYLGGGHGC